MKNYEITSTCLHFVQGAIITDVRNEGEARKKFNQWVVKHHSDYPGAPAEVKKQCGKTCGMKLEIKEVFNLNLNDNNKLKIIK